MPPDPMFTRRRQTNDPPAATNSCFLIIIQVLSYSFTSFCFYFILFMFFNLTASIAKFNYFQFPKMSSAFECTRGLLDDHTKYFVHFFFSKKFISIKNQLFFRKKRNKMTRTISKISANDKFWVFEREEGYFSKRINWLSSNSIIVCFLPRHSNQLKLKLIAVYSHCWESNCTLSISISNVISIIFFLSLIRYYSSTMTRNKLWSKKKKNKTYLVNAIASILCFYNFHSLFFVNVCLRLNCRNLYLIDLCNRLLESNKWTAGLRGESTNQHNSPSLWMCLIEQTM